MTTVITPQKGAKAPQAGPAEVLSTNGAWLSVLQSSCHGDQQDRSWPAGDKAPNCRRDIMAGVIPNLPASVPGEHGAPFLPGTKAVRETSSASGGLVTVSRLGLRATPRGACSCTNTFLEDATSIGRPAQPRTNQPPSNRPHGSSPP